MHKSKSIKKMIHAISMNPSKFEQIDNLDKIKHVQDQSVGLLSNEMPLRFGANREDGDEYGESKTNILQSFQRIGLIVIE